MLGLEVAVVEAVQQEVHKIRHYSLGTFFFKQFHYMVVCKRREFNKDFSDYTYSWLFDIESWKIIKVFYNASDISLELTEVRLSYRQRVNYTISPLLMQSVCSSFFLFIRSCSIQNPHKEIAVYYSLHSLYYHGRSHLKSLIGLHTVGIDRDYRDLFHIHFFKSSSDKADIVTGSAAATCLAHKDCSLIRIVFS